MPPDTTRVEETISVQAPTDRIWRIATDPRLAPRWNSNVVEVQGFTGMPIEVGSRWRQVVRILGHNTTMQAEVIECVPLVRGVVQLTGTGSPRITTSVQPDDFGVILTQVMEVTAPSGLGGMAMRLGKPTIQRELREALIKQKQAAEADAVLD